MGELNRILKTRDRENAICILTRCRLSIYDSARGTLHFHHDIHKQTGLFVCVSVWDEGMPLYNLLLSANHSGKLIMDCLYKLFIITNIHVYICINVFVLC